MSCDPGTVYTIVAGVVIIVWTIAGTLIWLKMLS
jgi:hypothetical protein